MTQTANSYTQGNILRAFDPKKVKVTVGGLGIVGFSEEKVMVERANNSWELHVGCDGEATRVKSNDLSGKVTLTLQQTSPSNDFLTSVFYNDQAYNETVEIIIEDLSGKSKIVAARAWCEKMPDATYAKTHTDRVWVFCTNNIEYFLAGNYESPNANPANRQLTPEGAKAFTVNGDTAAINYEYKDSGTRFNDGQFPNPDMGDDFKGPLRPEDQQGA